ncbi:aminoacyl--tRNA ligase-related protein [Streptosporangium sp. NPDC051023]|uniref:aminoacyl--tRNA ligase-related protein n=1 Tax=Streptosporangium sp. NPDC051023 TaxID=3155410 RepID=UPI00344BC5F3
MTVHLDLPERLSPAQARAIADRLAYSVEGISAVEVLVSSGTRPALALSHDGGLAEEDIGRIVEELVKETMAARVTEPRVTHRRQPESRTGAGAEARAAGPASAEGAAAARPVLHRAFDTMFRDLAYAAGATERRCPALIDLRVMERCRYVELFPQNAYLVDELPHHRPALARLRDGSASLDEVRRSSSYMLNPALCFHVYDEFSGTRPDGLTVVTVEGDCFRHEAAWRLDDFRLPSFTMREIVFFGSADEVDALRGTLLEQVWRLYGELGLYGRIETATDPFYYVEDSAMRQHQLLAQVKYELVASRPGGADSAIASFNNVRDSLCQQFDIRDEDARAVHSGCVAFGVDRWVELILETFGADRRRWPERILEFCA